MLSSEQLRTLKDFRRYAPEILRINTKMQGLQSFRLMEYQRRYANHLRNDFPDKIVRSIVLKCRQAGFSTLIAGMNCHRAMTESNFKAILLADNSKRTKEVYSIYLNFIRYKHPELSPNFDIINSEQFYSSDFNSGVYAETARDPYAGRSGTRQAAHLTEYAFYWYPYKIDEGVQNSVPIWKNTFICKESTANGMQGDGKAFYDQWQAAMRGESIYKPFFVPWYQIDNYQIDPGKNITLSSYENRIKKLYDLNDGHLHWRRLKLMEYANDSESSFNPEDRFKEDFPLEAEEAFLHSGRPVFDIARIEKNIQKLLSNEPPRPKIIITKERLKQFRNNLRIYAVPKTDSKYIIGADVAEGLESGDFSHAFILDAKTREQVGYWHGHCDSDIFGKILVELALIYNNALIVPEINNMGYATLAAIKNENYFNIFQRVTVDKVTDEETMKVGWRTTSANKQKMLSKLIQYYRENEVTILDHGLLSEMKSLTREGNGDVVLNGKDRVVACSLALQGLDFHDSSVTVFNPQKKNKVLFETKDISRKVLK